MQRDAVYGVFEIGMNHPGEIRELTSLVRPHVAVITNIEPAHIGNFASITDIADAKAEIFEGMDANGTAVLNRDIALFHHLCARAEDRSEEHTSELQSLMRISYAVFCLKKNN